MPAIGLPPLLPPAATVKSTDQAVDREVCVAIFAYNEQSSIVASIESVLKSAENAVAGERIQVVVLVNGCTDHTAARVAEFGRRDDRVRLQVIEVGDKANAWNTYVHELAQLDNDNRLHVFMDGDVTCTPDAISAMVKAARQAPAANAVATLPAPGIGRNRQLNVQLYDQDGAIFGNLYGLTSDFLRRVRERQIRIPRGAVGEDAIVTEMIAHDLSRKNSYDNRLAVCAAEPAGFVYPRLSPWRLRDIRLYINRRVRYAIRDHRLPLLRRIEFEDMPESMEPLDRQILTALNKRRWLHPLQWLARRRLRRALQK